MLSAIDVARTKLAGAFRWVAAHPQLLVAFAMGFGLGAMVSLEGFDAELTEGSGDILGAVVGTALAIGFGAWLSHSRERRERTLAVGVLESVLRVLLLRLHDLHQLAPASSSPRSRDIWPFVEIAKQIDATAKEARNNIDALKDAIYVMGLTGAGVHIELVRLIEKSEEIASEIIELGKESDQISDSDGHMMFVQAGYLNSKFGKAVDAIR